VEKAVGLKPENRRKPVAVGAVVLLLLLGAGIGGLYFWYWTGRYAYTDDASVEGVHVSVSSRIMGRISLLTVDEGSPVHQGQLLVQLDDTDLRAREAELEASLSHSRISQDLARISLEKARNDFQRARALFGSGNLSAEQYDHAAKALETAEAQYAMARALIEKARAQLGVIEAELLAARITAPISGVVARRSYSQGEVVQPGQAILLINDLDSLWVVANYEETKIRHIRPGAPARIRVDAYPDTRFDGSVAQVAPAIVPPPFSIGESTKTTHKIPVRVSFDGIPAGASLVPGMSVEVTVTLSRGGL
jgi:membrane fusion protein (multidrug efflux system)